MTTEKKPTCNSPSWLKPGALVKVQHWHGVVEDVAVSDNRIMVYIKSPKGVVRSQRDAAEWLEYIEGQIVPAEPAAFEQEISLNIERVQKMLEELNAFRTLAGRGM
jgi:predicted DNA-binding transcriptional regulator